MRVELVYPTQDDILESYSRLEPEVSNYFCLAGSQVFFSRYRKNYRVFCRGWQPRKFQKFEDLVSQGRQYICYEGLDFSIAFHFYKLYCRELLERQDTLFSDVSISDNCSQQTH